MRAAEKKIDVRTHVSESLPKLMADRRAVGQIMINLLSNAIKFTPAGGRVDVMARRTPAREPCHSVTDNGPGIPAQEIEIAHGRVLARQLCHQEGDRRSGTGPADRQGAHGSPRRRGEIDSTLGRHGSHRDLPRRAAFSTVREAK